MFADVCVVSTSTMADLKLPVIEQPAQKVLDILKVTVLAGVSCLQNSAAWNLPSPTFVSFSLVCLSLQLLSQKE